MMIGSTSLTRKGQITIPVKIRELLRLRQGDRIDFTMADNQVILQRSASVTTQTAGALSAHGSVNLQAEQLRENVEEAIADEALERAKGKHG
ncbi:MAG: AbrB/MazE/SpoVT family DNA-binding domain-containing protein [Kouleothrix sp.]|jgi:AbrB family looped-hinge helix DNA binding protein|nr:AbrB/MazE/SpoVT family DNA-binding domain-containing protein [Kouleothrix sp.]